MLSAGEGLRGYLVRMVGFRGLHGRMLGFRGLHGGMDKVVVCCP